MHWSERFLNVRYERGGNGPDAYDCWTFFRWVQSARFDVVVPEMPTPPNLLSVMKVMTPWAQTFGWARVDAPKMGDAVFMSQLQHPSHIGVWVDDLPSPHVLHCPQGGAVFHDEFHLKTVGWRLRSFYRYAGKN